MDTSFEVNAKKVEPFETLLVYFSQLKCLFLRCQKCGELVDDTRTKINARDGSQLTVRLHCWKGCTVVWHSQPRSKFMKGIGNIDLTSAVFFAGTFRYIELSVAS